MALCVECEKNFEDRIGVNLNQIRTTVEPAQLRPYPVGIYPAQFDFSQMMNLMMQMMQMVLMLVFVMLPIKMLPSLLESIKT